MNAPDYLKHKPIVCVNDYDKIDAQWSKKTDVVALSIGKAQYHADEISLKVWRHTGNRWSRQSEELPLHRNIDLNILMLGALMSDAKSNYPKTNLREEINNASNLVALKNYYTLNEQFLRPRLEELRDKLNEFLK
ncbi:DUF6530 family protein [Elizabethkingia anophelis]|uniref:DUF6530 family protein n=1 Tax=Elizabethkingia anophelis TaxID=1117645 RepID=UPI000442B771|nr:DUF6530 family protein [Elizabethkingia anophelis]MCT3746557.1 hypothetical protein [Elizabethkingia anophelis]MDC8027992.1 DUF6530 family protein [Elizabethkingia anophelis]MDV3491724.1 hypothetical protein [Elizabethkingia anophelis]MDV4132228.1 hypothetical protein [Elizabethkingia anophelis]MDV4135730.1 hypothetical protein [Elizabethkingia anophelis]